MTEIALALCAVLATWSDLDLPPSCDRPVVAYRLGPKREGPTLSAHLRRRGGELRLTWRFS